MKANLELMKITNIILQNNFQFLLNWKWLKIHSNMFLSFKHCTDSLLNLEGELKTWK